MDHGTSFPEQTSIELVPLEELQDATLRGAAVYWLELRGCRRFPSRAALNPRRLLSALRHMALVRVIGAGADYEYRIVGDSVACAFRVRMHNRLLSEILPEAPSMGSKLARIYTRCVQTREGFALRGVVGREAEAATFTHVEALILPMGVEDATVDHLLTFMVCEQCAHA